MHRSARLVRPAAPMLGVSLPLLALLACAGGRGADGASPGGGAPAAALEPRTVSGEDGDDPRRTPEPSGSAPAGAADSAEAEEPAAGAPDTSASGEARASRSGPDRGASAAADPAPRRWSAGVLEEMTLEEKVGQMMMPSILGDFAPEGSPRHERSLEFVERNGVGGIVMSVGSPTEVAAKLNDLQSHARFPLLVAADLETGVGFRMRGAVHTPGNIDLGGATDFPTLMALGATGDPELAYEMGRVTAVEARALGIHVPFAPVLDVNNNPQNPIINVRSFGEDAELVTRMGVAFVRGMQEHGVVATGKHFPGHGDTDTDSHLELPLIAHDRVRMDSVELRPFRAAIDAGMGGIMTAHITAPALNGGGREPATLSFHVLTDLLRSELGFGGLVFTDAMDMGAIDRELGPREAAVRAVEAGADVILMPPSVEIAIRAVVHAVEIGRIPESRIDASVARILELKERLGLHEERTVPLDRVPRVVGIPEHLAVADRVARRSITLLKNDRSLLPLVGTRSARVMSVTFRRPNDLNAGRFFNGRLRRTYPRLRTAEVDEETNPAVYEDLLEDARRQALVVVSSYVTAVSYQGSVALPDELVDFIERVRESGRPHVVISFGNPYVITQFPDVRAYMLAWGRSQASQEAAADALLGAFAVTGRVPTSIPPLFEIGDGIQLAPRGGRAGD